jgi:hypothetical protein
MKNLLATLVLLFLLGVTIHSSINAKVLPIIEGAELMDTLDAQNNYKLIQPELSAGIYNNVGLRDSFYYIEKYLLKEVFYLSEELSFISSLYKSCTILFFLKPTMRLSFNDENRFHHKLVNI